MSRNLLSSSFVASVKPSLDSKQSRHSDGGNLYLLVSERGTKSWLFRYRYAGKQRDLRLGKYPVIGLSDARLKRNEAEALVQRGADPSAIRRRGVMDIREAHRNTFESVALSWFELHKTKTVESTSSKNLSRLQRFVFPQVGRMPIADIGPAQWLDVLRSIIVDGNRRIETASRTRGLVVAIYDYAISIELVSHNPVQPLVSQLPTHKPLHRAAVTDPDRFGEVYRTLHTYWGTETVKRALVIAPMLAVRPGELRKAKWSDVSLEEATWSFRTSKEGPALVVPLPTQVLSVLSSQHSLTGDGVYVFPSSRRTKPQRPMSEGALLTALRSLGLTSEEVSIHGFRATFKTLLLERLEYSEHLIEMQLGHAVKDIHGRAYHRAAFLDQRRPMLQRWADYLEELSGANS